VLRNLVSTAADTAAGLPSWRRYSLEKPLTIVVLGMHRSGTSCITRMIHQCGASIGMEVVPANAFNKLGFWETERSSSINDALLALGGGSWWRPPERIRTNLTIRAKMRRFLGELHRDGTAVWKDPRTVLTYPAWKPLLQSRQIVAVFRHPLGVAQSLKRRNGFELEKGLSLWREYNTRLLAITRGEAHVHWIDFDGGPEHIDRAIRQAALGSALTYRPQISESYVPDLRTSDGAAGTPLDGTTAAIHAMLRAQVNA
jgi:hypothetical protein